MQQLILMRHAKAEEPDTFEGSDFERPLVKKGYEATEKMTHYLVEHQFIPELIVHSPYVRTTQTAATVLASLNKRHANGIEHFANDALAVGTNWDKWKNEIKSNKKLAAAMHAHKIVMVVGHEPSMSGLFNGYLGVDGAPLQFRKAAIALFTMRSLTSGELELFLPHQWL